LKIVELEIVELKIAELMRVVAFIKPSASRCDSSITAFFSAEHLNAFPRAVNTFWLAQHAITDQGGL